MRDLGKLDSFDKDILLSWFLHYMPSGSACEAKATRERFMSEFPMMYNRLNANVTGDVVKVTHLDGRAI